MRRAAIFALAAAAAACGEPPPAGDGPLAVAATLAPQAWLVEQIGGPRVEVLTLIAPGQSPATFQPTDAQVSRLMRSAIYFRTGVPAENAPWLEAVAAAGKIAFVDLRRGIELEAMPGHRGERRAAEPGQGGEDPHIWLSPRLLKIQARTVAEALEKVDPGHGDGYRKNLARLDERLDELDAELRRRLAAIAGSSFLVFHPSWGYFAADYGLHQVPIEIEGKEPSDREITELQRLARRERHRVVFVQPQIAGRSAEAVASAIGGRTETLDPLAADVVENLRRVADRLVAASGEAGG
jgi:zinc transport system substrate-binding protein